MAQLIAEMSAILGYLYLGGKVDAKDKVKLQKLGIKYILNCTPPRTQDKENGCPNYYEKEKAFVYKRIPIFDNKGEDILSHMTTAYDFIEQARHYGKVLVHCHKGVSRSASFVIGYLMRKNEFTFEEALSHVQMCRPIAHPNTAFVEQLRSYTPHGVAAVGSEVERGVHESIDCSMGVPMAPAAGPAMLNTVDRGDAVDSRGDEEQKQADRRSDIRAAEDAQPSAAVTVVAPAVLDRTVQVAQDNGGDDGALPENKRARLS